MALEDLTPRIALIIFIGWVVTVLFIKTGVSVWNHDYRLGILWLVLGSGLSLIFFRKRKIALGIIALTFILVTAGLTSVFHPSFAGILLTVGSIAALYMLIRWHTRRYPNLAKKDWKLLFDHDPES